MPYTTKSRIQNLLLINIDDSFTSQIEEWISVVKKFIDDYCGTSFEEASEARYFDGDGSSEILIDNLVSLTKIEILDENGNVDYTLDAVTDYYLYPVNKIPKNRIVINRFNADTPRFPKTYPQNVKITGEWGYASSVPDDIQFVATKLVADIIGEGGYDIGKEIKSEKLGEYSITYQEVKELAEKFKIFEILDRHRRIEV